jgi:SAM-dependent methyltransferase
VVAPNEWSTADHALDYLSRGEAFPPHREEGEAVLLGLLPRRVDRVLDLGCGDGRLLGVVLRARPDAEGVGLDASPTMLEAARARFSGTAGVQILRHDLEDSLPDLGVFDVIVSSFAIHHCEDGRKRVLYEEIYERLSVGGLFCNLEHVASPTASLHAHFFSSIHADVHNEDPSNRLVDVETQLAWLREVGFDNVDCHWKWLELAVLGGNRGEPQAVTGGHR